ncbi:UPF0481 protein At3g47200-like [Zingiber officinale]|uniref:UPF0481 protein At3g47200-like n=1 Tax=Zingiber officinale TaxID=94328 RepID=UPI001C4DA6AD|nr:UPF0481 protein At3g47200-like [Zingiber officinale]
MSEFRGIEITTAEQEFHVQIVSLDCEWMAKLMEKVEKTPRKDVYAMRATIFQVPHNFRASDTYGEAYNPKIVSVGPYHHGLSKAWDNRLKWPSLKTLLERSPDKTQAMEKCICKIKELEREVRSVYADELEMTSNEFVEMLLLDCCFVLELLLQLEEEKRKKQGKVAQEKMMSTINKLLPPYKLPFPEEEGALIQQWKWAEPLIYHDLLMLENQIPLSLLRELHGIILSHDKSPSMDELILSFFKEFSLTKRITKIPEGSCHHLLHLFHTSLIPKKQPTMRGLRAQVVAEVTSAIPCARDLIESRLKVKKKQGVACSSFLDLSFDISSGRLEIPEIHVDDGTNTLLRNLIAFEQCLPRIGDYLTTYAWFMDSVIDSSADVALLRREGVLVSGLGSDEEVARQFDSLSKGALVDRNQCYLEKTIKELNKYYNGKFRRLTRYCATFNHDYFSRRWAIVSVVAAIILFVLTFLQTIYSMCDSCHRT